MFDQATQIANARRAVAATDLRARCACVVGDFFVEIPPADGVVLLKSVLRTGTTNNDVNPVKSLALLKGGQANLSRLTSNTAWWVLTDAPHGLQLVMRRPLQRSGEGDFETDSARYKCMERYAVGWTQPRAVYGTAGQ